MIDFLIQADQKLFLFLNGLNHFFFDAFMSFMSAKTVWIPLYLAVAVYLKKNRNWKKYFATLLSFGLLIALSDAGSVHLFKNVFLRLRPCFEPEIADFVHVLKIPGGQYGFISSHASNAFAFAVLSMIYIEQKWYAYTILIWALLVSYSRIYLGVHYPGDVLVGGIWGGSVAILVYYLFILSVKIINLNKDSKNN